MTLRDSLSRTRRAAFGRVASLLGASELDDAVWEDLEALLIQADLGLETTLALTGALRERVQREGLTGRDQLQAALREELLALLVAPTPSELESTSRPLSVLMVVGANGSGKTTTIAKLAYRYQQAGRQVMLAAGDTFRAAAIEQLQRWGERVGVPVVTVC